MPVCALCENTAFDAIDGLYYCKNCGTQSQDIRDEAVEDMPVVAPHLKVTGKGKKQGRLKHARVKGKPWLIYEAFQWIIKLQVEYLVNLGVDPSLKDVVFKLWYRYLQLTGVAFTGSPEGIIPKQGCAFYKKDAKLLGVEKKTRNKRKKVDGDDELELCSHFSDEEFYEDDDPFRTSDKDDSDEEDIKLGDDFTSLPCEKKLATEHVHWSEDSADSSEDEDEFVGSLTVKSRNKRDVSNGYIILPFTLAFCHLGLLWINEPVLLSDLLRWAKEGQFPYYHASRHLPDHMKFYGMDSTFLCTKSVPQVSYILKTASQIAALLKLPWFPEQKWSSYTARYITDLHLPACLHGFVHRLIERVKPRIEVNPSSAKGRKFALQNFEAGAMAFIVVALKLCYGIDGRTEREQESLAEPTDQSPQIRDATVPLFTDWLTRFKKCEARSAECGVPWTKEQLELVTDSSAYSSFCRSDIFGSWKCPDLVNTDKRSAYRPSLRVSNEESQEKYAQLFKSLMAGKRGEEFGSTVPQVTSFPSTCRHVADSDDLSCFNGMHSKGIALDKLCDNDSKYIYYTDNQAFHASYEALLNILAGRIEMNPEELQEKVIKLENLLLFGRPLHNKVL